MLKSAQFPESPLPIAIVAKWERQRRKISKCGKKYLFGIFVTFPMLSDNLAKFDKRFSKFRGTPGYDFFLY